MRVRLLILVAAATLLSACQRVVLDERFHDDRLVKWAAVEDPELLEGPSEWRVEKDGWLYQQSNAWGLRGDFLGRWYGTYLVAGSEGWSDYLLSLRARPQDDDGFGVVVRFGDPEHFYRLIFMQDGRSGGPFTRLDKREGAEYTELARIERGYKVGVEMHIEVEAVGQSLSVIVDGSKLIEVNDASYRRGKVGLFCYAQKGQAFDDVKVVSR